MVGKKKNWAEKLKCVILDLIYLKKIERICYHAMRLDKPL